MKHAAHDAKQLTGPLNSKNKLNTPVILVTHSYVTDSGRICGTLR